MKSVQDGSCALGGHFPVFKGVRVKVESELFTSHCVLLLQLSHCLPQSGVLLCPYATLPMSVINRSVA